MNNSKTYFCCRYCDYFEERGERVCPVCSASLPVKTDEIHVKASDDESIAPEEELTAAHPEHYSSCGIEPLEFILANNLNFAEGNIVKLIARWKKPTGGGVKSLYKLKSYAQHLIDNATYYLGVDDTNEMHGTK